MINKKEQIKIINLGNIIFWHEEILYLLRTRYRLNFPLEVEKAYSEIIGFKPTFYSIHLVEVNRIRVKVFAFTFVDTTPGREAVTTKLFANGNGEIPLKLKTLVIGFVYDSINGVLNNEVGFSQTTIAMELFAFRVGKLKYITGS